MFVNVSTDPVRLSLSQSHTNSASPPCGLPKLTLEGSFIYSKSPVRLMHATVVLGPVSAHLSGRRIHASTICFLLTQCSNSALYFTLVVLSFFVGVQPESLLRGGRELLERILYSLLIFRAREVHCFTAPSPFFTQTL